MSCVTGYSALATSSALAGPRWGSPATRTCPGRWPAVRCILEPAAEEFLGGAVESMGLTGRGFDRALKVARTIADLEDSQRVTAGHMAEALSYRDGFGGEGLSRAG